MNDLDLFSDPYGDGRPSDDPRGRQSRRRVRKRQKRRRRNGRAAALFALAFLVAVFGTGGVLGYAWLDDKWHPPDYEGRGAGNVTVQIKDGASGSAIGTTLEQHRVVKSSRAFVKAYTKELKASSIQPGFYQMRLKMSSAAAMALLLDPKSRAGNQVTIPEGLRAVELYKRLEEKTGISAKEFQAAAKKPQGLGLPEYAKGKVEGYLYPGRYDLDPNGTAAQILKQMVGRFNKEAESTDLVAKARKAKMNPATVVTLASLVQAEGGKPSDLPRISRVIYNRIDKGMKLQFDTTVLYALNERRLKVTQKDLLTPSPYNTYLHKGLPPGPISNPGPDAIEAALAPEDGTWLYFIATDPTNKVTKFATTEEERLAIEKEFRAWQKEHPGQ
ncbi:endolytic transglycosylase MltG [Actinomadura darangshiensis]|uniref:Endolytic murein transglycosylase n=1 Tax=Actinomadura darangshiensis TaxID=705336 RepID=A0A4R5AVN6_9ACTN|nr:endolytic transglycosylase MltG [Actinomadura darangshiensis]TDD76853.1 endolytic transglycosylase MltG [Actinomadura darangshiensis]